MYRLLSLKCGVIEECVMGGDENEQIGVGQDWVCFDVEKVYGGEEDEVLWPRGSLAKIEKILIHGRWKASDKEADLQRPGSVI